LNLEDQVKRLRIDEVKQGIYKFTQEIIKKLRRQNNGFKNLIKIEKQHEERFENLE